MVEIKYPLNKAAMKSPNTVFIGSNRNLSDTSSALDGVRYFNLVQYFTSPLNPWLIL